MRILVAVAILALVTTACSSGGDDSVFGCQPAPEGQRHSQSEFPLSISANPVAGGDVITLYFGSNDTPGGDNIVPGTTATGWGSSWQCWNGVEWVDTHLLEHGTGNPGEVIARDPEVVTTMPAVGMPVPDSFEVTVPDVDSGWYRIEADVHSDAQGSLVGHVAVEVTSGP